MSEIRNALKTIRDISKKKLVCDNLFQLISLREPIKEDFPKFFPPVDSSQTKILCKKDSITSICDDDSDNEESLANHSGFPFNFK